MSDAHRRPTGEEPAYDRQNDVHSSSAPTSSIKTSTQTGKRKREPATVPPDVRRPTFREATTEHTEESTDTDWGERFHGGGESITHLWGKLALHQRRQAQTRPWFRGTYEYERTVSDWVADCLITGSQSRAWIEFIVSAGQCYRAKTRAALQFGYPIYWVFLNSAEGAQRTAHNALVPDLDTELTFGTFDPEHDRLTLGDAVTFANFRVPIETRAAFRVPNLRGYRAGAAHIPETDAGFDLGWVRIAGEPRRVYAIRGGRYVRLVPPAHPAGMIGPLDLDDDTTWFARRIAAGEVERIGPIPSTSTYERRTHANLPLHKDHDE